MSAAPYLVCKHCVFSIICLCTLLLPQEVISALRGTGQEVTLRLCRPERGVLPEMDTSTLVSQLMMLFFSPDFFVAST